MKRTFESQIKTIDIQNKCLIILCKKSDSMMSQTCRNNNKVAACAGVRLSSPTCAPLNPHPHPPHRTKTFTLCSPDSLHQCYLLHWSRPAQKSMSVRSVRSKVVRSSGRQVIIIEFVHTLTSLSLYPLLLSISFSLRSSAAPLAVALVSLSLIRSKSHQLHRAFRPFISKL